jgi:mRNA interferase RelE/StbE
VYKVVWKNTAAKQLAKIDKKMAQKITDKIEDYLAQDPINRGERLLYDYKGLYRYRFSDYRIIYEVKNLELVISVVKVAHRREVY